MLPHEQNKVIVLFFYKKTEECTMGKYALITGASGGIGSAVAHRLAADGYSLYLHYHHNENAVRKLQQELASKHIGVTLVQADLTDRDGAEALWSSVTHELDAIVYTAGKKCVWACDGCYK
ncbi:hypothetical protein GCM10020331_048960 [Ectobacillus funiculus]